MTLCDDNLLQKCVRFESNTQSLNPENINPIVVAAAIFANDHEFAYSFAFA